MLNSNTKAIGFKTITRRWVDSVLIIFCINNIFIGVNLCDVLKCLCVNHLCYVIVTFSVDTKTLWLPLKLTFANFTPALTTDNTVVKVEKWRKTRREQKLEIYLLTSWSWSIWIWTLDFGLGLGLWQEYGVQCFSSYISKDFIFHHLILFLKLKFEVILVSSSEYSILFWKVCVRIF